MSCANVNSTEVALHFSDHHNNEKKLNKKWNRNWKFK